MMAKKQFLTNKTGKNMFHYKYAHYQFEIELHPDDDPEGLYKKSPLPQPNPDGSD